MVRDPDGIVTRTDIVTVTDLAEAFAVDLDTVIGMFV